MLFHIVKPNETIEEIAKKYNLNVSEIKSANTQFRSWEHLAPGLKIAIPEIPSYIKDEIDDVEPFIEDYYPTINIEEVINRKDNEMLNNNIKEETKAEATTTKVETKSTKIPKYKYPPIYYPNGYYHNYYGWLNQPFRKK